MQSIKKPVIDIGVSSTSSTLNEKSDIDNEIIDDITNADLKSLRIRNLNKIVVGHLNINSIRNKLYFLAHQVKGNIDILLMISETKVDKSFPPSQFFLGGYSVPFRLDRNGNGGGILLYIRGDLPSKLLSINKNIEGFFVEINLRNKKKWLLSCSYNPTKMQISNHFVELSKNTDLYLTKYDQLLFLGDFNVGVEDSSVKNFCSSYNLTSMINRPTCYKNPEKPSCIDLILTNCPRSFQNSCTIETGLSDFHKPVVTAMKTTYKKSQPKITSYRSYKYFNSESFREELIQIEANGDNCDESFKKFISSCNVILNKHVPQKKKYVKGNQSPFMNKTLSEAIIQRSKLRNLFLKKRTEENTNNYVKQRNLCVTLLRKNKREFFGNLNETHLCDNKNFWGVFKPLLSNKVVYNERITLVEDDKIIENDKNTASILNEFFSNIITTLGIPQYNETEPVNHNIGHPLMKAIMKYRFHPSIVAIKKNCTSGLSFSFSQVKHHEIVKEINNLKTNNATRNTDIPTKLIKENSDIFGDIFFGNYNNCVSSSIFPNFLQNAIITPVHKKGAKSSKDNYRPVSILSSLSKIYERLLFK